MCFIWSKRHSMSSCFADYSAGPISATFFSLLRCGAPLLALMFSRLQFFTFLVCFLHSSRELRKGGLALLQFAPILRQTHSALSGRCIKLEGETHWNVIDLEAAENSSCKVFVSSPVQIYQVWLLKSSHGSIALASIPEPRGGQKSWPDYNSAGIGCNSLSCSRTKEQLEPQAPLHVGKSVTYPPD